MLLILCHADDTAAIWLHDELCELGVGDVEAVAVEALVYSRRIVHRLDDAGDRGEIALADGRILRPEKIAGAVNRVRHLPTAHIERAAPRDRAYAREELNAFLLAWLDAIAGRVINPALPLALDGGSFPVPTLIHFAAIAGLPTRAWRSGTREDIPAAGRAAIVFDGTVFGPILPQHLQDGCIRLAVLLGVPLLEIAFGHSSDGEWQFRSARGMADFRIGGRPLAKAMAAAFATRAVAA